MVAVAQKNHVSAVWRLLAEAIDWTNSKTTQLKLKKIAGELKPAQTTGLMLGPDYLLKVK